jgi:hypothetical protein
LTSASSTSGAVAGQREIGRAALDAVLQARVEQAHLVPRLCGLLSVTQHGESETRNDQDDDEAAHDRHPSQHRSVLALLRDAVREPFLGCPHDARQEHVCLVHQGLAAVGAQHCHGLAVAQVRLQRDRRVHLADLVGDHAAEPPHHGHGLGIAGQRRPQGFEMAPSLELGVVIGSEIDLVAAHQIAALARFGGLQGAAQLDGRRPQGARLGDEREIDPRALAQPDGRSDDADER